MCRIWFLRSSVRSRDSPPEVGLEEALLNRAGLAGAVFLLQLAVGAASEQSSAVRARHGADGRLGSLPTCSSLPTPLLNVDGHNVGRLSVSREDDVHFTAARQRGW